MSAPAAVRTVLRVWLGAMVLVAAQLAAAATVTWKEWTFDHEVSGNFDGLALKNVKFRGRTLIFKLSLPVLRVFYQGSVCGPYADRLGGTLSPIPWAGGATLAQREFSLNGRQWYEIGIRDQIGNYDLYQVYYLSADGILDAHIYSKGLQCGVDHVHFPNWRIDFDVDGSANNVFEQRTASGFQTEAVEFDSNATAAVSHGWRVRNALSNLYVDILPGYADFSIPDGTVTIPNTDYSRNTVFGRIYRASEDTGWTYGPNRQVPYNDGEGIVNADLVGWYEAYMPHAAADGSQLWHSTGIRLVSSLTDSTPPTAPANLVATAASANQVNLTWSAAADDVAVTGYTVDRCVGAACSDFAPIVTLTGTSFLDTGVASGTAYRYRVRATDAVGNWGPASNTADAATPASPSSCTVTWDFASIADDKVVYRLSDVGTTTVTLDTMTMSFPSPYVGIKEIRLGGASIFKSSASVPPVPSGATIGTWTSPDVTKRQLKAGTAKNLEVLFAKKSPKGNCPNGACFSGAASFSPGCQVTFGP